MSKFKMKKGSGTANADTPGSFSSLDTSTVQGLNNMAFSASNQLEKAAFPQGGQGLTSPKPTKSFQFSGQGPSAYEYEKEKGAQRLFGKSASQLNESERIQNVLDARGLGKVRNEGGILEQKEKFEKQFGSGSSRMFNFVNPKATVSQVQGLRGKAYDRAVANQKKLSADMYNTSVDIAKTMQKTGGSISTLKPKGIDMNLNYKPPMQAKSKQAKQKLLKNVAKATNKSKAPYSLASVAIQALKIPFTRRAYGAREGAKSELRRKAGLVTYGKMRLF